MSKPELREMRPNAHCRVCERVPENKEDHFVSFYSRMNRGQYIHLCPACVGTLYVLAIPAFFNDTNKPKT